jgi:cobalamin biosynthesis protein CbiD
LRRDQISLKHASQPCNNAQPLKKKQKTIEEEKLEYARSAYINVRIPHIKSGIDYKTGNQHKTRVSTKGQEFIKFSKANVQQEKKQSIKTTNNVSYSHADVSHMSYHDFDVSYVLMRNKIGKIVVLHVGPHHKRSKASVWVPKCLVTNLRGPNQT